MRADIMIKHRTSERFWQNYSELPGNIRALARKNFRLLLKSPKHPSLHFKKIKIKGVWSVRVGSYRALAYEQDDEFLCFWIGTHAEYDRLIK